MSTQAITKVTALPVAEGFLKTSEKTKLRDLASEIRELTKLTAQSILTIGARLTEAKKILGHGRFLEWIDSQFGWSQDTAERFMRVHAVVGPRIEAIEFRKVRNLEIDASALYLIARRSTPEPVIQEVLDRAKQGEHISHSFVRGLVTNRYEGVKDIRRHMEWEKEHRSPPDLSGDISTVKQVVELEKRKQKGPISQEDRERRARETSWTWIDNVIEDLAEIDLEAHGDHLFEYLSQRCRVDDVAQNLPGAARAIEYVIERFVRAGFIRGKVHV
jgi:hypothetical protein